MTFFGLFSALNFSSSIMWLLLIPAQGAEGIRLTTLRLNRQGAEDLYVMEFSWQVVAEMLCFSKWESIWKYILICAKTLESTGNGSFLQLVFEIWLNTMYNLHDVKSYRFNMFQPYSIHVLYMFPAADLPFLQVVDFWEEENPYQYDLWLWGTYCGWKKSCTTKRLVETL